MAGGTTLIATTRSGVRPLGVRGEPLHNSAGQLRRVVRRRLGDGTAGLLADPQPHDDGTAIDWYADWPGDVRPLEALDAAERIRVLADVDRDMADISGLGDALALSHDIENTGVVGRSLKLAARRPADSFVFLVGDRPVVVAWGYEQESAPAILLPPAPPPAPLAEPVPLVSAPPVAAPVIAAAVARSRPIPFFRTFALALPLLLLLMGGSWLLRGCIPLDPALAVATREGPPAPPAAAPPPDPLPVLKASLSSEEARQQALQRELAMIDGELRKRIADCKPPEPPKPPPQVAAAPPPPPQVQPKPQPQPAARHEPPPQSRPPDDKLRLPAPTNDYSFMQGCWRTDPFQHERGYANGVSTYCFDRNGYGRLEWRRGRTACRTDAQARFEGDTLRLRDRDATCNDGSHWYADSLVCRRGADNVAQCSGTSQGGTHGPVAWTVNLHKLN